MIKSNARFANSVCIQYQTKRQELHLWPFQPEVFFDEAEKFVFGFAADSFFFQFDGACVQLGGMGKDKTAFRLSWYRNAGVEPHRFPAPRGLEASDLDERRTPRKFGVVLSW